MSPVIKKVLPTNNTVPAKLPAFAEQQPLTLTRPMQDSLDDGTYEMSILRARIVPVNGNNRLGLDVTVTDQDGNETEESFLLKPDFRHPSSAFYKLLVVTGFMPGRGEELDVGPLAGQQVKVTLKTVTKADGSVYTNILDVPTSQDQDAALVENKEAIE